MSDEDVITALVVGTLICALWYFVAYLPNSLWIP
jgi:hypothetical protein